jgi:hypothetical protein
MNEVVNVLFPCIGCMVTLHLTQLYILCTISTLQVLVLGDHNQGCIEELGIFVHTGFRCVHKLVKATVSFVMSVHLHGTTRLPLDGFWLNLILRFSKICRENSSFIKI